ncbi:MAG: hypothetical protein AAF191_03240 [Verrucomicrobiota bacterium]
MVLVLGISGCDRAVDPGPGDLQGVWRVNEQREASLGRDSPVIAQLQLENRFSRKVRLVDPIGPGVDGWDALRWKPFREIPKSMEPGATWEGVWLLENPNELEAGDYALQNAALSLMDQTSASFRIGQDDLPEPMRLRDRCLMARLTGETEGIVAELSLGLEEGTLPPSTYLQLAELFLATGEGERARHAYEDFAQTVYGEGPLPAWLRSRMDSVPSSLDSDPTS